MSILESNASKLESIFADIYEQRLSILLLMLMHNELEYELKESDNSHDFYSILSSTVPLISEQSVSMLKIISSLTSFRSFRDGIGFMSDC